VKAAALAALLLVARVVAADDATAERRFREAMARGDISALEQLGAERPLTIWSDDAWAEAARLALRENDFTRARKDLEQVIAIDTDAQLVRRARNELARIRGFTGSGGEWAAVAAEHERLQPALQRPGDPRPVLEQLEQLVRAHPAYPRAPMLMVALAAGWEREGESTRAIAWLRQARQVAVDRNDQQRIAAELVRALIRAGALAEAEYELALLARDGSPGLVTNLRKTLARAELRRTVRWIMWGVLAVLAAVATIALRRAAGSWRAALRRLGRPPMEALFLVPIGAVVVGFSLTGNPLIARTVAAILGAGVATSWLSGAILAGRRVELRRAIVHAAIAVVAILASVYLAVDRGHVIDFIIETWHQGHERG
jgi:predicted negative regulator of RcsB-dependent stress response